MRHKTLIMALKNIFWILLFLTFSLAAFTQNGSIHGTVSTEEGVAHYATVYIENSSIGTYTQINGSYKLDRIPFGTHELIVSYVGYAPIRKKITLDAHSPSLEMNVLLSKKMLSMDAVVITGTKTFARKTSSPVIVNVVDSKTLDNVRACNLSEGLKFQPGLRVETDCQTCNYTQLRINGLAGAYSQILINGRPIFSPLTSLYGMEQLPVNMIDRIEVVRGGGSSLYGSSAIGGTVNVMTKIPKKNSFELNYNYQNIHGQADDHQLMGNASVVDENGKMGATFFVYNRQRELYDHNGDNYSEIPSMKNSSFGSNLFYLPRDNQKIELNISHLNEYRYGGEKIAPPAHLAQQAEERTHHVWMANADYQINFNNNNSSLISYMAWQNTDREHYTGIVPDDEEGLQNHLKNPPYGTSDVSTYNVGLQLNHRLNAFPLGQQLLTLGTEYLYDEVFDIIPSYHYLIDQTTKDFGLFLQSDWELTSQLKLLSGARMDIHNLTDEPIVSPRVSLMYKFRDKTQFRLNYGTGFRAPQAFDTDLHIAFAGGGVSRVSLSPTLSPERSHSINGSVNYDYPSEHFIAGFTLEGFYTRLRDAFFLQPIGQDDFGQVFEKRNGSKAVVQGIIMEIRANFDKKIQIESGLTVQKSEFLNPVQYIDGLEGIKEFIRTPNEYGFANLNFTPSERFSTNINYLFTGQMKIPHFAGAPNQNVDEIITSTSFHEVSAKLNYTINPKHLKYGISWYVGVKNIFDAYQGSFDIGKNRDSNFVYGPAQPRTFFIGIKLGSE